MDAPRSSASFCSPAATSAGTERPIVSPCEFASEGRGRSVGRFNGCGTPSSCLRQYSTCCAARLSGSDTSPSTSRCHCAYSLYCTGSGSHCGAWPSWRAA